MIRVAMLSFWHVHAKDYAGQAVEHPDTEIVAIWDEVPERGRQKADEIGVKFFESLQELLSQPEIEGVIVGTPTSAHHDVIIAAAKAGKHIFTEKVLALTTKECEEILGAVEAAGVKLTVSLPRLNMAFTQAIQQILQDGLIGEVSIMRLRLAHNGALPTEKAPKGSLPAHFFNQAESGGGALIDLGCHPMYLARLFLGFPDSISASFSYITGREVEDSAVSILCHSSGAISIVEAGFVNSYSQFSIEVQGTEGSLSYSRHDNKLFVRGSRFEDTAVEWREQTNMPAPLPSAFEQWISHIKNGTAAAENLELALDLTRLMEASYRSARSGSIVYLNEEKRRLD
jgi:predicted dehydrogenase